MDIEEDKSIMLIQKSSLLKNEKTIIVVVEGKLIMRVGDEKVEFNYFNMIKYP